MIKDNRGAGALVFFLLSLLLVGLGYFMVIYGFEKAYPYINSSLPINNTAINSSISVSITVLRGWVYLLFFLTIIFVLILSYRKSRTPTYALLLLILVSSIAISKAGSYDNWRYQRIISIDGSGSDVVLKLVFTSSNFTFSHAKDDGSDIIFLDENGNLLKFLRIYYNPTEEYAKFLVRVSSLPCDIVMLYGNPFASDQQANPNEVYDYYWEDPSGKTWLSNYNPTVSVDTSTGSPEPPSLKVTISGNGLGDVYVYEEGISFSFNDSCELAIEVYAKAEEPNTYGSANARVYVLNSSLSIVSNILIKKASSTSSGFGWTLGSFRVSLGPGTYYIALGFYVPSGYNYDMRAWFDTVKVYRTASWFISRVGSEEPAPNAFLIKFYDESGNPSTLKINIIAYNATNDVIVNETVQEEIVLPATTAKFKTNFTEFVTKYLPHAIDILVKDVSITQFKIEVYDYTQLFSTGDVLALRYYTGEKELWVASSELDSNLACSIYAWANEKYSVVILSSSENRTAGLYTFSSSPVQIAIYPSPNPDNFIYEKVKYDVINNETGKYIRITVSSEEPVDIKVKILKILSNGSSVVYESALNETTSGVFTYSYGSDPLFDAWLSIYSGDKEYTVRAYTGRGVPSQFPITGMPSLSEVAKTILEYQLPSELLSVGVENWLAYGLATVVLFAFGTTLGLEIALFGAGAVILFMKFYIGGVTIADSVASSLLVMAGLYAISWKVKS